MLRSRLKSIATVSLVFSWLLASIAPGLLVHLGVGSRLLAAATVHSDDAARVALALVRGELCGFAAEIEKADQEPSKAPPATEASTGKVVLGLVESGLEISIASRPEPGIFSVPEAHGPGRAAPPGPPPRVI